MSKGYSPQINPRVLEWSRTEAGLGLEIASKKIGVETEKLEKCEAGEDFLTIAKLRNAARVYRRPPAIFFLRNVPAPLQMPVFRRLPEHEDEPLSSELRFEVRRIYEKRAYAIELAGYGADYTWDFIGAIKAQQDPEEVGMLLRTIVGVPEEYPGKKMDSYGSFNYWRDAIESTGTIVFQVTEVSIDEMRGLSIAKKPYPVIAVNRKDPPEARAFSLLHEFCHIMLGKSTMCEFGLQNTAHSDEVFSNHAAGAALVPKKALLALADKRHRELSEEWDEGELRALSTRFGVSREVILRRLLILGKTTEEFYGFKRQKWKQERAGRKPEHFGEKGHERVLRTEGVTYTKLVLNALSDKAITKSDLSDMLGMKLRHLQPLEQLVFDKR